MTSSYSGLKTSPVILKRIWSYSENVLAECFTADRNPHTFWVGVYDPYSFLQRHSRSVRLCGHVHTTWSAHRCWLGLRSRLQLDPSKSLILLWWSQSFIYLDACFVVVLKEEVNLHFQLSTWGLCARPVWYLELDGDPWFSPREKLPWRCCHHHSSLHLFCSCAVCLHQPRMLELRQQCSTVVPVDHKTFSKI